MQNKPKPAEGILEVTPKATELMKEFFKNRKRRPLRLFVKVGGCGIRVFGVVFEKKTTADELFKIDGFEYIVDKVLLRHVQPIKVDSDGFGFRISGAGVSPQHGCGTCGFLCSDGSRCSGDCATCPHKCAYGLRKLRLEKERLDQKTA